MNILQKLCLAFICYLFLDWCLIVEAYDDCDETAYPESASQTYFCINQKSGWYNGGTGIVGGCIKVDKGNCECNCQDSGTSCKSDSGKDYCFHGKQACTVCDAMTEIRTKNCGCVGTDCHDGACSKCASDSFISQNNCVACQTEMCQSGSYMSKACTMKVSPTVDGHDKECTGCPKGSYCKNDAKIDCIPGEYCNLNNMADPEQCDQNYYCPVSTTRTLCNNDNGEICDQTSLSAPISGCRAGKYWSGTQCISTEPGYYSVNDPGVNFHVHSNTKQPCQPGTYQALPGMTSCVKCGQGTFSNASAATFCFLCEKGTFANDESKTVCSSCGIGAYSDIEGSAVCKRCAPGHYQRNTGSIACDKCQGKLFQTRHGANQCDVCSSGMTIWCQDMISDPCRINNASTCQYCPLGTIPCPCVNQSKAEFDICRANKCVKQDIDDYEPCMQCPANHYCLFGNEMPIPHTQPVIGLTYISSAGNHIVDNILAQCTVCKTDEFSTPDMNCTRTADRTCRKCKNHVPYKTYVQIPCTETSDTVLADCSRASGHFEPSGACSPCLPGTRKVTGAAACVKCPPNTLGINGMTCEECPALYISDAGSSQCSIRCNASMYSPSALSKDCLSLSSMWTVSSKNIHVWSGMYHTIGKSIYLHESNTFLGITNFGDIGGVMYTFHKFDKAKTIAGDPWSRSKLRTHGIGTSIIFGKILDMVSMPSAPHSILVSDISIDRSDNESGMLRMLTVRGEEVESKEFSLNVKLGYPSSLVFDLNQSNILWISDQTLKVIWKVNTDSKQGIIWRGQMRKTFTEFLVSVPLEVDICFAPSQMLQLSHDMLVYDSYVIWKFSRSDALNKLKYVCGDRNMMQNSYSSLGSHGECSTLNLGVYSNVFMTYWLSSDQKVQVVLMLTYYDASFMLQFTFDESLDATWNQLNFISSQDTILAGFVNRPLHINSRMWITQTSYLGLEISIMEISMEGGLCKEGLYYNKTVSACLQSPVGTFSPAWSTKPTLCPVGTTSQGPGGTNASWCKKCEVVDMTTYEEGDLNCVKECPVGKLFDVKTKTCSDTCDFTRGFYYDSASPNICELCPLGTRAVNSLLGMNHACEKCGVNEYGFSPGICANCPLGTSTMFPGSTMCVLSNTNKNCGSDGMYAEHVPCSQRRVIESQNQNDISTISATASGKIFISDGSSVWKVFPGYDTNVSWHLRATVKMPTIATLEKEVIYFESMAQDVLSMPFGLFEISNNEQTLIFTEYGSRCIWKINIYHEHIDDLDTWKGNEFFNGIVQGSSDNWIGECNANNVFEMNGDKYVGRLGAIRDMALVEKDGYTSLLFVSTESADGCMNIRSISLFDGSIATFLSSEKILYPSILLASCLLNAPYKLSSSRGTDILYFAQGSSIEKINVYAFKKELYTPQPVVVLANNKVPASLCSIGDHILVLYTSSNDDAISVFDMQLMGAETVFNGASLLRRSTSRMISCAGQHVWYVSYDQSGKNVIREQSLPVSATRGIACLGGFHPYSSNVCMQVGLGTFKNAGLNDIKNCKSGTFGLMSGAGSHLMCKSCPAGKISQESAVGCEACPSSASLTVDGSKCENSCPVGFYIREKNDMEECVLCPTGHTSKENARGIGECIPCQEGYYSNRTTNFTCVQCPQGFVSPKGGFKCIKTCGNNECSTDGVECTDLVSKYEIITSIQIESKMTAVLAGSGNNVFFSDGNKLGYFIDDCPSYVSVLDAGICIKRGIDLLPPCLGECLTMGGRGITSMAITSGYHANVYPPTKYLFAGSQNTFSIYKIPIIFHLGSVDVEKTIAMLHQNQGGNTGIENWKLAGQGLNGFADGTLRDARFGPIADLVLTKQDDYLIFTDFQNHRIRLIDLINGTVSTVLGNGRGCWKSGYIPTQMDSTCSISANTDGLVNFPNGLSIDDDENVYLAMRNMHAIGKFNIREIIEGRRTMFSQFCSLSFNDIDRPGLPMTCQSASMVDTRSCYLFNPFDIVHYERKLIVAVTEGLTAVNIDSEMCESAGGNVWEYVGSRARGYVEGGVEESKVNKPFRLSVAKDRGILYVADMENKAIRRFFISGKCNCAHGSLYMQSHRTCYDPTPPWSNKILINCSFGFFAFESETYCRPCTEAFALGITISQCILWKMFMGSTISSEQLGYSYMRIKDTPFVPLVRNADWFGISPRNANANWNDIFRADSNMLYALGQSDGHAPYGKDFATYTFNSRCIGIASNDPACWVFERKSDLQPQIILPGFWYPCNVNNLNINDPELTMTCSCPWNIGEFDSPNATACRKPTWSCLRIAAIENKGLILGAPLLSLSDFVARNVQMQAYTAQSWSKYFVFGSDKNSPNVCSNKAFGIGPCFPTFQYVRETCPTNLFDKRVANRENVILQINNRLHSWNSDNVTTLKCGVGWPAHYYCPNGYVWLGPNTTAIPNTLFKESGRHVLTCASCLPGTYSHTEQSIKKIKGGPYQCLPCAGGMYSSGVGSTACVLCPDNTYADSSSGFGSTSCIQCPANHYSVAGTWSVLGCTPCSPGTGNCTVCAAGYFQNKAAQDACIQCPAGYFSNTINQPECAPCPLNTFQSTSGRQGCNVCPLGSYTNTLGSSSCVQCSSESLSECSLSVGGTCGKGCGLNHYWDLDNQACVRCPTGKMNANSTCSKSYAICEEGIDQGKYIAEFRSPEQGGDVIMPCPSGSGSFSNVGFTVCQTCNVGTFSLEEGQGCNMCLPGSFSNLTNATSCDMCLPGHFSSAHGASVCKMCVEGTYELGYGSSSCKLCGYGSYSAAKGQYQCALCPNGTYSTLNGSASVCSDVCDPQLGLYSGRGASACTWCDVGSVSADLGSCIGCGYGMYAELYLPGQNSAQRCVSCPAGKYNDWNQTAVSVDACKFCNLNTEYVPAEANAQYCVKAPIGHVSNAQRTGIVACGLGRYRGLNDSDCQLCFPGSYSDKLGSAQCALCPKGRFQGNSGSSRCLPCSSITVASVEGSASCYRCSTGLVPKENKECVPCPISTYAVYTPLTDYCASCPFGKVSPAASSELSHCIGCRPFEIYRDSQCFKCSPGTFSVPSEIIDGVQFYRCQACPAGAVNPYSGSISVADCVLCGRGYIPAPNQSVCVPCQKGQRANVSRCLDCDPGTYSPDGIQCIPCIAGTYAQQKGQSSCAACSPGTFSDVMGSALCSPCPIGTYTNVSNTTLCKVCTMELGFSFATGAVQCTERKTSCSTGNYIVLNFDNSALDHSCTPCPICSSSQYVALKGSDTLFDSTVIVQQENFMGSFCPGNETSPRYLCVNNAPEAGTRIVVDVYSQYAGAVRVSVVGNADISVYRESCIDITLFPLSAHLVEYVTGVEANLCYVGCKYGLIDSGLVDYVDIYGMTEGEDVYGNVFFTRMLAMAASICSECPLTKCPLGKYRQRYEGSNCGPPCMLTAFRSRCSIPGNEDGCLEPCKVPPNNSLTIDGSDELGVSECPWQCNQGYFKNDNLTGCLSCFNEITCEEGYVPLPPSECKPNSQLSTLCMRCSVVFGGVPIYWDIVNRRCVYRCQKGFYSNSDQTNCFPCISVNETFCGVGEYKDVASCIELGKPPTCKNCTVFDDTVGLLSFSSDGRYSPDECFATCKIGYNTRYRQNNSMISIRNTRVYSSVIKCEECNVNEGIACRSICFRGQYRNIAVPEDTQGACVQCKRDSDCGAGKFAVSCTGNETSDPGCRNCDDALLIDYSSGMRLREFVPYNNPLPKASKCPTLCKPNYVSHNGACISCKSLVEDVYKCKDETKTASWYEVGQPKPCEFVYSHWNATDDTVWWESKYSPYWMQDLSKFTANGLIQRKGLCWPCPSGRGTLEGDDDLCEILPGYGRQTNTISVETTITIPSSSTSIYAIRREPRKRLLISSVPVQRRRLFSLSAANNNQNTTSIQPYQKLSLSDPQSRVFKCPIGFFKTDRSNNMCTKCPEGTSTLTQGSLSISECVCLPGHRRVYNNNDMNQRYNRSFMYSFGCVHCGIDMYRSFQSNDESKCLACSVNETTFDVLNATTCACKEGFIRNSVNRKCELCPRDNFCVLCFEGEKYCPLKGVHVVQCFPGSTSPPGSTSILNCTCNNGTVQLVRNSSMVPLPSYESQILSKRNSYCLQPPANAIYDKQGKRLRCPDGWTSYFMNSTNPPLLSGCSLCPIGSYATHDPSVPSDTYENGQLLREPLVCRLCPIGTYSSQPNTIGNCTTCPYSLVTTKEGATSVAECGCPPTMVISNDGKSCMGCEKNQYLDENVKRCVKCPPNAMISQNILIAKSIIDCVCLPGYSLYAGVINSKNRTFTVQPMTPTGCSVCHEGTFSPFASNLPCKECPTGSTTASKGSKDIRECGSTPDLCLPGFKWVPGRFGCVNSTLII